MSIFSVFSRNKEKIEKNSDITTTAPVVTGKSQESCSPTKLKTSKFAKEMMEDLTLQSVLLDPEIQVKEKKKRTGLIAKINVFFRNYFYNCIKKGDKAKSEPEVINKAMRVIGGKPIDIKTHKGVQLKGMYFKADSLVRRMQLAGVQRVMITRKDSGDEYPAMVLDPKSSYTSDLLNALSDMKLFENKIWHKKTLEGKIYIFTKESYAGITSNSTAIGENGFDRNVVSVSDPFQSEPESQERKTVILNGGIWSHFERGGTAAEVAKLITLGFDVIVSEDKNPTVIDSESHGNVMANRDAIYEYLKKNGVKNEDMIWKGTCFGSVPAVEAAAKYQGSHVWIDQGYFKAENLIQKKGGHFANLLAKRVGFKYNMKNHLPKVKGKVIIIDNKNDGLCDPEEVKQMTRLLRKKRKDYQLFQITDDKIAHAGLWANDVECNKKITEYLKNSSMTSGNILS